MTKRKKAKGYSNDLQKKTTNTTQKYID